MRAASFPTPYNVVALGKQIGSSSEIEIGKGSAKIDHERLVVFAAATRLMQGYCSRMSGAALSSTTAVFHGLPQNSVNHRPTMALFRCCSCGALVSAAHAPVSQGHSTKSSDFQRNSARYTFNHDAVSCLESPKSCLRYATPSGDFPVTCGRRSL